MEDLVVRMSNKIEDLVLEDAMHGIPILVVADNLDPTAIACVMFEPVTPLAMCLTASQCKEAIAKLQEIIAKYEVV